MKVLILGTSSADQWEKEIKMWSVLEIRGGTVKLGNVRFRDPAVHDMEYYVQSSSDITILGQYNPVNQLPRTITKKTIDLSDVMFENGYVEIDCYIQTQPRTVQMYRTSCGQCQVTDGYYRLTINIVDYTPNEKLVMGTPITIAGEFSHDSSFFSISNMDDISIREGGAIMSADDLRAGFHPVIALKSRRIDTTAQPVVQTVQPVQLAQPVQHVQSVHIAQPMQLAQPIQPVQTMQPIEQTVQPVQLAQSVQLAQPIQPQPFQPVQTIQPVEQTVQPVELAQSVQHYVQSVHVAQHVQPAQPIQPAQLLQPAKTIKPVEPIQAASPIQPVVKPANPPAVQLADQPMVQPTIGKKRKRNSTGIMI
ncbi:uncharacterized protein LOC122859934 [Aphidius gifuensis]|uniref:uncharacterized protein LOC122859934 n=1 Tax=Aphidius gifuensis TaxID=684658 RepID=UPI001CDD852B|nr:uncharacterized protein LOC122859934 [Aphidius gifuensis]